MKSKSPPLPTLKLHKLASARYSNTPLGRKRTLQGYYKSLIRIIVVAIIITNNNNSNNNNNNNNNSNRVSVGVAVSVLGLGMFRVDP